MLGRVARETLFGQVFYPDELPFRRGNMTAISAICFVTIISAWCLGDAVYRLGEISSFLVSLVCYLNLLLALELVYRLLNYTEERRHLKSRYKGSIWHLVVKLLDFTIPSKLLIYGCFVALFCIVLLKYNIKENVLNVTLWQKCGIVSIGNLISRLVHLSKNPVHDSIFLELLPRLDYGSGMAQNFFHGYLRLCLPSTGTQEKGIKERIDDYISRERLPLNSFPVKKLFVLIPSSTYLPDDLKDCSAGWMESTGPLEDLVRDRAGVKSRIYKHTVYKIKDPDDPSDKAIYVVAEGATPCKTLYENVQRSGVRKEFFEEHQMEILLSFYETLREILQEDRDCRGLCELIYYYDVDAYGGNNVNVAILIKQRIYEILHTHPNQQRILDRTS